MARSRRIRCRVSKSYDFHDPNISLQFVPEGSNCDLHHELIYNFKYILLSQGVIQCFKQFQKKSYEG
ncbi:hypothetical protein pb186bvf_000300 [Paramecium bursaria]